MLEQDDFYFEGGLLVLTRRYHLKRGYCCGNGCRHCPFDHVAVADSDAVVIASSDAPQPPRARRPTAEDLPT